MRNSSFPELNTERLTLRKLQESDSEEILFLRSDDEVNKFIYRPEERRTKNLADALSHIRMVNEGGGEGRILYMGYCVEE